jgi:ankyrin repeat protein
MRASFPPGYRFKRSPPASLLLGAFRRRDMAAMAALIAAGADLNQRYSAGQLTLLYIAAVEGGEEMVKFLCSYKGKIDLNLPDCDGITPLYIAVQNNREGVVEILCAQDDIDTNAKDKHGNSALWKAVWDQKYAIVEILLRNQTTNLNILNKEGETPLKIAFFNQDKKMVDLFCQIRDRIDVQKIFLYLNRFLSVSLIRKDLSWFKFLYVIYLESRQENISVLNEIGVFYLLLIILTNNPVALEFMEECTHKFINGKTYLSRIINMLNEEGEAPLFFAAKHGQAQFFSLLLKNGADLRLEDKEGFAPLYIAARNGHANMVKLFIQA